MDGDLFDDLPEVVPEQVPQQSQTQTQSQTQVEAQVEAQTTTQARGAATGNSSGVPLAELLRPATLDGAGPAAAAGIRVGAAAFDDSLGAAGRGQDHAGAADGERLRA